MPWALACLLLASCAAPGGLVRVEEPPAGGWVDDGSLYRLNTAIDRSIAYYERLPEQAAFSYGELRYSPREMIASLELFRRVLYGAPDWETFTRRLHERFHVFQSVPPGGEGLFTGYFEPELEASETPTARLDTPVYALPPDIVKVRLRRFSDQLPQRTLVGRVEDGELVPYYTRAEIEGERALARLAEPIAYVHQVDLFFLQVQGSGRLRFPDGRTVKVGYAASNGHPYRSIGALLVRQNELDLEEVSLQSIRAYLRDHPERVQPVLFANPSYVFFRVLEEGPLGNIRVPLTPRRSLALDHRRLPKGALAYIATRAPVAFQPGETRELRRFMLVQDTGGAITGHGRGDVFWGAGEEARWIAGHQKHPGRLWLFAARKEYLPAPPAAGR